MRSPLPEEEGEAETTCDELIVTPHSLSPCTVGGGGEEYVENPGVKLCPGRREGWREGILRFGFISHYLTLVDL